MVQPATKEQITKESAIFNDAWRILKKYYNLTNDSSDEEWEALIEEARILYEMPTGAKGSRLARDLSLAVLSHIETLSKERKQGE